MNCDVIALAESVLPKISVYVKSFDAISPYDLEDYRQDVFVLAAEAVKLSASKPDTTPESIFWQKFIFHTKRNLRAEMLLINPDDIESFSDSESAEDKLVRFEQDRLFVEGMRLATEGLSEGCKNTWHHLCGIGEMGKLSLSEIAEVEGVSMSTVRSRISRTHDCIVVEMRQFIEDGKITKKRSTRRQNRIDLQRQDDRYSPVETPVAIAAHA